MLKYNLKNPSDIKLFKTSPIKTFLVLIIKLQMIHAVNKHIIPEYINDLNKLLKPFNILKYNIVIIRKKTSIKTRIINRMDLFVKIFTISLILTIDIYDKSVLSLSISKFFNSSTVRLFFLFESITG